MARLVTEAWEQVMALSAFGSAPLTVGWYRGAAYVRLWNFRTGAMEWRRYPRRDGEGPARPAVYDPFSTRALFEALR